MHIPLRLACALLALAACAPDPGTGPDSGPRPQDPLGDRDDEESQRERLRWIEVMHRSAPDVDWRAVERENQEAERRRRLALAGAPVHFAGGGQPWEEIGSSNQAGHTRCAALGPSRAGFRHLYVGSANGGLWRGPQDGSDWAPISDHLFGGVDDVVVLEPANLADEDILVLRRGADVFRSDDGGATWTVPSGLTQVIAGLHMLRLPDAQQTILLLARASVGGLNRTAVFRSEDLGQTFTREWTANTNWSGDMWAPQVGPGAGSDVYVVQAGRIRKSTDRGATFTLAVEIDTSATEGHISGSEAGSPTLYCVLRVGGVWQLYRSDDGGQSAPYVRDLSGYWGDEQSLCGFSSNPQAVVYGGVEAWRSFDGGQSFTRINTWGSYYGDPANKLHADIRGISVLDDPDNPLPADLCYFNTDGGTYLSWDLGLSVQNLSLAGLGVGQFYSTFTSANDPDLIVGGTQDQGYQRGTRLPSSGAGPSTPFDQLISGDYGHLGSSDGTHDVVYCTYPGFVLIQDGETNPILRTADFPGGASHLWLPPVLADPLDANAFFFLADRLWRYTRNGNSWNPAQYSNRDFAAGSGSYLSALAFAPSNAQRAYAATDAGRLWWSTDRGVTWTESANSGPNSHYFYGSALLVDPADELHAFVGGSGYGAQGVKETTDGGQTWTGRTSGLPSTLTYDLAWEPGGTGAVYAATEAGAFRYDPGTQAWENVMGLAAPATTYWSVETVEAAGRVRFGTYGRGIWDYEPGDGALGERYCDPAVINSTGAPGVITASGSSTALDNDLLLLASDLPPNQFAYFIASETQGFVQSPAGSMGDLCLGGSIARFSAQAAGSGTTGSVSASIDLTAIPANPLHQVVAGETWSFQCWYRDVVIFPTSNFTDGVAITFD